MKRLLLIFVIFLTACSGGTNENMVQTAIAETQAIENKIATSLVETQQAIPTDTPTSTPKPTSTPDQCSDEILQEWYKKVEPIANEFFDEYQEYLDLTLAGTLTFSHLGIYEESSLGNWEKLKLIDHPRCTEKAIEYLLDALLSFANIKYYIEKGEIDNVLVNTTNVVDLFSSYAGEIKKLGILDY